MQCRLDFLRCDLCDKVFTHSYAMRTHLQAVHSTERFPCAVCVEKAKNGEEEEEGHDAVSKDDVAVSGFASENRLSKHMREKHPGLGTSCKR